jgi:hypothetical protein
MSVNTNNLIITFKQLDQAIDASMPQIYQRFYQLTPVKTGNARSNTSLNGRTIQAQYPYAGVLDAGRGFRDGQMRGSTQAPNGMSQPTIDYAKQIILQKIKSVGI